MADVYSATMGNTPQGVSINSTRRIFNFGERVAELAPMQSPFFTYLSKVAKKPTDDPVFKFLERRHQWQRRNAEVKATHESAGMVTDGTNTTLAVTGDMATLEVDCLYDKYGRVVTTAVAPQFFIAGQTIAAKAVYSSLGDNTDNEDMIVIFKAGTVTPGSGQTVIAVDSWISLGGYSYVAGTGLTDLEFETDFTDVVTSTSTISFLDNTEVQVIGSAWAEGSADPEGWRDEFYSREGYCQIFKTAIQLFSGTSLATRYRGVANEYKRVWQEKLMEHKMDIEHTMLFGVGQAAPSETSGTPTRYSWGIVPYTEMYGKVYNFTYSDSGYDDFLDAMEDFFAPESGNSGSKLVMASRKIITFLNKLGSNGFLDNTIGASQYRLDVTNIPGNFGHNVTKISTIYGDLHFVAQPLFRGMWEDYAIAVDMKNIAYRPLSANGHNRDTHIVTNVQNNDIDGRKDLILTEAGLEIDLPETHAILKWSV